MSGAVTAWLRDPRARPRRDEWAWFAIALLATFAVAFAISLAGSHADGAARAPSSAALGGGPPAAAPVAPARLREVAPVPRLQKATRSPTPAPARSAPARPAITVAPTATATTTTTPTQVAAPGAPVAPPAPTRAPPRQETETRGQEFDSSG
jgi:hypothetical protein